MTLAMIFVYWLKADSPGTTRDLEPREEWKLRQKREYQRQYWETNHLRRAIP